ncbi:flavorubredoxin [Acetoanaerobium pronyense]|uniref:Flavorubredoxin n=1 Tax=Acetoanaerobium pronyense TaxID=1482736 RepID=A0ABS4KIC8_9FIRM|nr:FprA family A-type flavoprotein [Acetoanaerobium pronyense]MBP2027543.1 flavorubredoxin [Acetoanaerobium pronyense]
MNTLSVKITDNLHYIGVNDRETHLFENMWPLDNGISYNSYLIDGEKTALLDTVKITKVDNLLSKLTGILGDRKLDYLVIHHMEPDHSGSIKSVVDMYPEVTLVGNKKTQDFLEAFYGITGNFLEVKEGDSLDLGDRKLTFYMTPMVHWPESMVSFDDKDKILFSQDAFGGFGALDGPIFDDEINWDFYESETRRYYSNIVGKHSKQVQMAIKKLEKLEISMICPVHGPVWRSKPEKIIELYDKWSKYDTDEGVVIVYGTMYGNTSIMAETIARVLAEEGIKNIKMYDVSKTHVSHIINEVWKYKGLILGSCTYNNGLFPPMKHLVNVIQMNNMRNHILGVFGSYSWSGGAVKSLRGFAETCEYDFIENVVEAKCSPTVEDLDKCAEIAKEMAKRLKA